MSGVEEDQVRERTVDVLRRERVLGASPKHESTVVPETLCGYGRAPGIDVERVEHGVRIERAEKVERAVAGQEPDLHDGPGPHHPNQSVQQHSLVTLNGSDSGRFRVEREVRHVGRIPPEQQVAQCGGCLPERAAAEEDPALAKA